MNADLQHLTNRLTDPEASAVPWLWQPLLALLADGSPTLYTWCALDTLIFPTILGLPAQVQSPCHTTGEPVRLSVDAAGVTGLEPQGAVVPLVDPADLTSIRSAFCNEVHCFAAPEAAQPWLQEHPGAAVLPGAQAHQLARPLAQSLLVARAPKGCC